MLRTPFCDLIGLDVPIVQAAIPPYTYPDLVAAVSNAGALGSYATAFKPVDQARQDISQIRGLTDRPFAANFLLPAFDQDVFEYVLSDPPPVISFAVGNPETKIQKAKEAGSRVIVQIHTVEQARDIAPLGPDAIIAQGTEAGGLGGTVALMPLLPQVVDAVDPIPVIAAGGIADGRGLAAALVLGAQGVNIGTRFVASEEAAIAEDRRLQLLAARSQDALQASILKKLILLPQDAYDTSMRSLRTGFLDEWEGRETVEPDEVDRLRYEIFEGAGRNRIEEYLFAAGQSVGLIDEILPAAEIIRRMASGADTTLANVSRLSAPTA